MPTKATDTKPTKTTTSKPKTKPTNLRWAVTGISGTVPAVQGRVVFDPKNHTMKDGTPLTDKMQELEDRGVIKRLTSNAKVGDTIPGGNTSGSLSMGELSKG